MPAASPVGSAIGGAALRDEKEPRPRFFSAGDGLEYDNLFIFDEVGWNFEPSELSAAFGLCSSRSCRRILPRASETSLGSVEHFAQRPDVFVYPSPWRTWTPRGICSRCSFVPSRVSTVGFSAAHGIHGSTLAWCGRKRDTSACFSGGAAPGASRRASECRPGDGAGARSSVEPRVRLTTTSTTSGRLRRDFSYEQTTRQSDRFV